MGLSAGFYGTLVSVRQSVHIRFETTEFVHYVTLMRSAKLALENSSIVRVSQPGNQRSMHDFRRPV